MAKWLVASKKADFDAIASKYNIDKVIARIIRNRDVVSDEEIEMFLNGTMQDLHAPNLMKDMDKAADILKEKIKEGAHIRIIGDYDVDGICSTYILLTGLRTLNANVDIQIPHRIKDGYGLNDSLIEEAKADGVDLILTCDNGIAACSQIELAQKLGIEVIVTDHHEVPFFIENGVKKYSIPPAVAVVDHKQEDCEYPFKSICGAFIAYKLVEALLDKSNLFVLESLIPFAALATICDVMELKDENRIIVKEGLRRMSNTDNLGLKALLLVNGLDGKNLTNYHMGFVIGPCLNATGRLDTAKRALELFDAKSFAEATKIATELKELNESRKKMTEDGVTEAISIIETEKLNDDDILVLYLPATHESLAGIIAGRIKEKYNKPTFVITDAEEGLKGSGRSIEDYDMYEGLTEVKDLFTRFGGHKMAAGISLNSKEDLLSLRKRLNDNSKLTEDSFQKKVHIDVPMPLSYINEAFVRSLDILEPFGTGNPKPVFATKEVSVLSYRRIGKNKNVGKFKIADVDGRSFDMVYFGDLDEFETFVRENADKETYERMIAGKCSIKEFMISIVYYPEINEYRGISNIQIIMNYYSR